MNDVLKAISSRYTCRDYADRSPSSEDLEAIVRAALESPSGVNRQPWRFIVVQDRELIEEMDKAGMEVLASFDDPSSYDRIMSRGGKLFYNAPCMIVIATLPLDPPGAQYFDCGIAAQNIVLAATSLGLATTHCGFAVMPFAGARAMEFKEKLSVPEGCEIAMAILIGYEKQPGTPHEVDPSKVIWV